MSRRRAGAEMASALFKRWSPDAWYPSPLRSSRVQPLRQPRKNPPRVVLKNLLLIPRTQRQRIDITLRIVIVVPRPRVDTAHSAHHFRPEQDVVDWNHLRQQLDAGQVINTRIHVD